MANITNNTVFYSKDEFDKTYEDLKASIDVIWIITATINILLMQIGFLFLEVGQVNEKNKTNLLISNLIDTFISAVSYYTIGYAFANDAFGGLIGNGPFFLLGLDLRGLLGWVFQYSFCSTTTTIVSGSLAERTYIDVYIVFAFLMSGILYPISAAWVWGGGYLQELGFKDFAGAGVVHLIGGFGGLIGTIILGPRIGKFEDSDYLKARKRLEMIMKQNNRYVNQRR